MKRKSIRSFSAALLGAVSLGGAEVAFATDLTWNDETIVTEKFSCQSEQIRSLAIVGVVTLVHPSPPLLEEPAENTVVLHCGTLHFRPGSELRTRFNLRIIVDEEISGDVRVVSTRGTRGLSGVAASYLYVDNDKASSGTNGQSGGDGDHASITESSSNGQRGADAGHGSNGGSGQQGSQGADGLSGSNLWITTRGVSANTTFFLSSRGGDGGSGGRGSAGQNGGDGGTGGDGGSGGNASLTRSASNGGDGGRGGNGGNGGNGGRGGKGGNGGSGGDAAVYVVAGGGLPAEALTFDLVGGEGGWPGIGGAGGLGGSKGIGGAAGCGGKPKNVDLLQVYTVGASTIVLDKGLPVRVNGRGHCGSHGSEGVDGRDGAPGGLGEWGNRGNEGNKGKPWQGLVSLADFDDYKSRHLEE